MINDREAFVTTLNTDSYLPGVIALDKSLRETCAHRLFVLVSHGLADATYEALRRRDIPFDFAEDIAVDPALFAQADAVFAHWKNTLFKLRLFELSRFDKMVFIDSDMMVLEPIDDLFDRPDMSATVAGGSFPGNEGWREFSSGLMVIESRAGVVEQLIATVPAVAAAKQSFGDQDVLNALFCDWPENEGLHLPESYNVFFDHYAFYLKRGGVKALHFIGRKKPWMMSRLETGVQILRCVAKGNVQGIGMLLRYRRYMREVGWDG